MANSICDVNPAPAPASRGFWRMEQSSTLSMVRAMPTVTRGCASNQPDSALDGARRRIWQRPDFNCSGGAGRGKLSGDTSIDRIGDCACETPVLVFCADYLMTQHA